ncbi:MAG: hypothetical protein GY765_36820 [bacterium]|nr:hypothetical protein [bacterium]
MWNIIKAELNYNKKLIAFSYGFLIAFYSLAHLIPDAPARPNVPNEILLLFMLLLGGVFHIAVLSSWKKNMHTRYLTQLPLPGWKVGCARVLFANSYWMGMVALFFLFPRISKIFPMNTPVLSTLLLVSGIIVLINSLQFLSQDIPKISTIGKSLRKFCHAVVYVLYILLSGTGSFMYMALSNKVNEKEVGFTSKLYNELISSYTHGFILLAAGLFLSALAIATYTKKQNYLEG